MTDRRCATCEFYDAFSDGAYTGLCRRNAPVARAAEPEDAWWPTVGKNDWCGEYRPNNVANCIHGVSYEQCLFCKLPPAFTPSADPGWLDTTTGTGT